MISAADISKLRAAVGAGMMDCKAALEEAGGDMEKADYLIPANDDAINSIKMMADLIAEAVSEGKAELEKNKNAAKMVAEQSQKKVAPAAHRAATIAESV